jgi:predicted membrane protein
MRNTGQILIGALIIVAGLLSLFAAVFHIDLGLVCWPTALILLGVWFLVRPHLISRDTAFRVALFGPIRQDGAWQVTDQEIWLFVGDVRLDLSQAEVPERETRIRIFGLVSDVRLTVPDDVGVSVSSLAVVSEFRLLGEKREQLLTPLTASSPSYDAAGRKIRIETLGLVSEVKVEQA